MYKMLRNCSIVEFDYRLHFCYGEFLPIIILLYIIRFTLIIDIIKLLYNCSSYKKSQLCHVVKIQQNKSSTVKFYVLTIFLDIEINSNYGFTQNFWFFPLKVENIKKNPTIKFDNWCYTNIKHTKHEIHHMYTI